MEGLRISAGQHLQLDRRVCECHASSKGGSDAFKNDGVVIYCRRKRENRDAVHVSRNSKANLEVGIRRLFKFPQMDFEMAIWEMTSLLIAPKKVFRSIYYHVCCLPSPKSYLR